MCSIEIACYNKESKFTQRVQQVLFIDEKNCYETKKEPVIEKSTIENLGQGNYSYFIVVLIFY